MVAALLLREAIKLCKGLPLLLAAFASIYRAPYFAARLRAAEITGAVPPQALGLTYAEAARTLASSLAEQLDFFSAEAIAAQLLGIGHRLALFGRPTDF